MAEALRNTDLENFLLGEVNGLRMEAPLAAALNLASDGRRTDDQNYDIVYSSDLSRLPDSAARRFIRSAIRKVKPGGCLLLVNTLAKLSTAPARRKNSRPKCYPRTPLALAELTHGIPADIVAGQVLVLDESAANVCLELHTRKRYSSRY